MPGLWRELKIATSRAAEPRYLHRRPELAAQIVSASILVIRERALGSPNGGQFSREGVRAHGHDVAVVRRVVRGRNAHLIAEKGAGANVWHLKRRRVQVLGGSWHNTPASRSDSPTTFSYTTSPFSFPPSRRLTHLPALAVQLRPLSTIVAGSTETNTTTTTTH